MLLLYIYWREHSRENQSGKCLDQEKSPLLKGGGLGKLLPVPWRLTLDFWFDDRKNEESQISINFFYWTLNQSQESSRSSTIPKWAMIVAIAPLLPAAAAPPPLLQAQTRELPMSFPREKKLASFGWMQPRWTYSYRSSDIIISNISNISTNNLYRM